MTPPLLVVAQGRQDHLAELTRMVRVRCGERYQERLGPDWLVAWDRNIPVRFLEGVLLFGRYHERTDVRRSLAGSGGAVASGRALARDGWGSYAVVLPEGDRVQVMAEPSGAMPLTLIRGSELNVVASSVDRELLRGLGLSTSIDTAGVAACLADPAAAVHLELVEGVRPVQPGSMVDLGSATAQLLWDPCDFVPRSGDHEANLREAVNLAVGSLSEQGMLIQLSGGLDSAIVGGTLAKAGRHPPAMNFATNDPGGDERAYARLAAAHSRLELIERIGSRLPDYRMISKVEQLSAPFVFGLDDAFETSVDEVCRQRGLHSVMTGQGGDAVFFQPATELTTVDRFRVSGWSGLSRFLPTDARRNRTSVWPLVLAVIKDRIGRTKLPYAPLAGSLLTEQAASEGAQRTRQHPWVRAARGLPPGKRMQVQMIANSQIFHAPRPSGANLLIHPLLSQPVIEAALRIPTFELASGSIDRGLARRAFRDRLPGQILHRQAKGDASMHYSRAARSNLPFLREHLLDGALVSSGLVRADVLDELLSEHSLFFSSEYLGLAALASCEAWLRAWKP